MITSYKVIFRALKHVWRKSFFFARSNKDPDPHQADSDPHHCQYQLGLPNLNLRAELGHVIGHLPDLDGQLKRRT